jgi:HSP20 family protein
MLRRLPAVWREPLIMGTSISRMMDDLLRDFDEVGFDIAPAFGRADVYEKDKSLVFETELPGMRKDEIDIQVEDGQLVISGEMKRSQEVKEENYFRIGRRYGEFRRAFPLPVDVVDKSGIRARFEDGILKVSVPLKQSIKEKERPLDIKVE